MIDTLRFKLYCSDLEKRLILSSMDSVVITRYRHNYLGRLRNLTFLFNKNYLTVFGSIPKFYAGYNTFALSWKDMFCAFDLLKEKTGVSFLRGKIVRLDMAFTIRVNESPFNYCVMANSCCRYDKRTYEGTGVQFVNKSATLSLYDKFKEGKKSGVMSNSNLLRYEFQQKRDIKKRLLKVSLYVRDLFNLNNVKKLLDIYLKRFNSIVFISQNRPFLIKELHHKINEVVRGFCHEASYIKSDFPYWRGIERSQGCYNA